MKCAITAEESKTKVVGLTSATKEVMLVGDLEEGLANEIKGFVVQTGGRRGDCNVVVTGECGRLVCSRLLTDRRGRGRARVV